MTDSQIAKLDTEIQAFENDKDLYYGQPSTAQTNIDSRLDSRSAWQEFCSWLNRLKGKINEKLRAFRAAVEAFFRDVKSLHVGDPAKIHEIGGLWLHAQRELTGIDSLFTPYYLPALNTWTGEAGDIYCSGIPVQRAAVARLGAWAGAAGTILQKHASEVATAFIAMRLIVQTQTHLIANKIAALLTVGLNELPNLAKNMVEAATQIADAVVRLDAAWKEWATTTMDSVSALRSTVSDRTGTEMGAWPRFV